MDFSLKDCIYIGPVTDDRYKSDLEKADIKLAVTSKKDFSDHGRLLVSDL